MNAATTPAYGVPTGRYRPLPFPARTWSDALRRALRHLVRGVSQRREDSPVAPDAPSVPADLRAPGIDELYAHRRLPLVRLALLLVDDLPTAEDVVQDVLAALYRRHGERLAGLENPGAYLRTSVVNISRSVLRRRRTVRAHVPEREGHPVRRTAVALLVVAAAVIGVLFVAIHEVREPPVSPANRPSVSPTPSTMEAVPGPPQSGDVDASPNR
ncbi:RNA polymerase sigma factor [Streptomyces sp. NPDC101455]|uniref:RNA polymerase sigma factor n=1 Tax=Streptomyces sp. NPDC101455 TaxID=3366142 RepID=UPI003807A3AD